MYQSSLKQDWCYCVQQPVPMAHCGQNQHLLKLYCVLVAERSPRFQFLLSLVRAKAPV